MFALLPVGKLQHDGPLYVQPRYFVESGRGKEDLGSVVEVWALGAGRHDERVASIVFIEALYGPRASHAVAGHLVEVIRVVGVEPATTAPSVVL